MSGVDTPEFLLVAKQRLPLNSSLSVMLSEDGKTKQETTERRHEDEPGARTAGETVPLEGAGGHEDTAGRDDKARQTAAAAEA